MSRTVFLFVFVLYMLLLSLAAMLVGCGASHGTLGTNGFNVVGTWQANFSVNVGATATGFGAIDSAGVTAFFDNSGNIVQMPTITGASSFSGNLIAYAVNGFFFPGGATQITDTAQGQVTSATAIGGTFTGSANSGTFTVAPVTQLNGTPSGTMTGKIMGFIDTISLTFGSGGSFTGSDSYGPFGGCPLTGTLTQQTGSNVFDVSYSLAQSSGCSAVTETGIAFQSHTDYLNVNSGASNSYLYLILLTSTVNSVRPNVIVVHS